MDTGHDSADRVFVVFAEPDYHDDFTACPQRYGLVVDLPFGLPTKVRTRFIVQCASVL